MNQCFYSFWSVSAGIESLGRSSRGSPWKNSSNSLDWLARGPTPPLKKFFFPPRWGGAPGQLPGCLDFFSGRSSARFSLEFLPVEAVFFSPCRYGGGMALDAGLRVLDWGRWTEGTGLRALDWGYWTEGTGLRVLDWGHWAVFFSPCRYGGRMALDAGLRVLDWGHWAVFFSPCRYGGRTALDAGLRVLD